MIEPDVVVVASGPGPVVAVPAAPAVVAADGGLDRALSLGLEVDVVIGDLDSVSPEDSPPPARPGPASSRTLPGRTRPISSWRSTRRCALGGRRVLVVASAGGRLDHLLSVLLLLGSERYEQVELDALVGDALVHVIRTERVLHGDPGEIVTLLALGGPAERVTTSGLEYPLQDQTLEAGSSRAYPMSSRPRRQA